MATVCTACGTENRDKARYCRGCARPLVPLGTPDATAEPVAEAATPHHKTRRSRSRARRAARQRRTAIRWGLGAVVLVAGLIGWQLWPGATVGESASVSAAVAPAAPVEAPAPARAVLLATATEPAPAAVVTTTATMPEKPSPRTEPVPLAVAPQRAKPAPARPKEAPEAPAPAPAPARSEPAPAAPVVAEAPPAPAVAPRPRSVDETCADRSNVFSRDFCRIQACGNPAMAGDPVCVRFREMEAANRSRTGN